MLIEPSTHFFDVPLIGTDGTHKIAVYEWGNVVGNSGTVFCVHGLTRNGRDFDILASALSENYRVLSVDMAGRGKSQWHSDPVHYNYGSYVSDIAYLAAQLQISGVHWIGTSMGGILGMMMANNFPGLIKTLILNDVGCLIPAAGLNRISKYVGSSPDFETRVMAEDELRARCAPYGIKSEEHWQNLFAHSIQETADGKFRIAYDPAIGKSLNANPDVPMQDVNLWPLWEAVKTIPTLLIRGVDSDLLTHATAIEMEKTHPDFSLLEIDGVGHAPALMDEVQINAIRGWIKKEGKNSRRREA
ncbi:MAG: alpha/beta hydrolase [Rickettsiales bacterium]